MSSEGGRREEILETAALMFASSGLRTSLKQISDASGILPGSLYHHFESKEAIVVELVRRYRDELDGIGRDAVHRLRTGPGLSTEDQVVDLGEATASCAVRNRAALILTLYEAPTAASPELADLAARPPSSIDAAMLEILEDGRRRGEVRDGVDLVLLAERLRHSMLHTGVGSFHRTPAGKSVPALRCRILLHGLAVAAPDYGTLDRSAAMQAARSVVAGWGGPEHGDDPGTHIRTVARTEFARRGFETTTIRDIAAAAGTSTTPVYRLFGSKEALLASIMESYEADGNRVWSAIVSSVASPLEKLDATCWANVMLMDRFPDEFRIHLGCLRQSPPAALNLGQAFELQLDQVKRILAAGVRSGELRAEGSSADVRARSVMELVRMPGSIVAAAGPLAAHALARESVLRGVLADRRAVGRPSAG